MAKLFRGDCGGREETSEKGKKMETLRRSRGRKSRKKEESSSKEENKEQERSGTRSFGRAWRRIIKKINNERRYVEGRRTAGKTLN